MAEKTLWMSFKVHHIFCPIIPGILFVFALISRKSEKLIVARKNLEIRKYLEKFHSFYPKWEMQKTMQKLTGRFNLEAN